MTHIYSSLSLSPLSLPLSLSSPPSLQSTLLDCLLEQTHPELLLKEDKQVRKELIYEMVCYSILLCMYMCVISF